MAEILNVLFCDDDNQFAQTQSANLSHKLLARFGIEEKACRIHPVTHLNQIRKIATTAEESEKWDVIFCDLGWGSLTLEGIQILNDIQLNNPRILTVLYTAQDENETITQALEWKLNFVDQIIRIDGTDYFKEMLGSLERKFSDKRRCLLAQSEKEGVCRKLEKFLNYLDDYDVASFEELLKVNDSKFMNDMLFKYVFPECNLITLLNKSIRTEQLRYIRNSLNQLVNEYDQFSLNQIVSIKGMRTLPKEARDEFSAKVSSLLDEMRQKLLPLLKGQGDEQLAADINMTSRSVELILKANPVSQKMKRYEELIKSLGQFPKIEDHDLLPLSKFAYIEFVKEKYSGFPQMAEARGLDLNNIYRVNRKFKNSSFIVFKFDTIKEIIGIYEKDSQEETIKKLLANEDQLFEKMKNLQ